MSGDDLENIVCDLVVSENSELFDLLGFLNEGFEKVGCEVYSTAEVYFD